MSYQRHLMKDKKLAPLVLQHGAISLKKRNNVVLRLCASIMSQQLSGKVAQVIYARFLDLFDGAEPTPRQILRVPYTALRAIGLSRNKADYVRNVALFAVEKGLNDAKLSAMTDEEVIRYLTQIKGVGRWTAEMILIFTLARKDVFAVDDLGIQQAMIRLYSIRTNQKAKLKERMLNIAAAWSPYRTYACLHLWKWKDESR
ncbi:MAG: DNA-3-methyladenine glycosylase [Chitinophagales bacterium]|nr:MAG: DNA-3-methyladenine glycosylase [Chitinophagales bacterium]